MCGYGCGYGVVMVWLWCVVNMSVVMGVVMGVVMDAGCVQSIFYIVPLHPMCLPSLSLSAV